MIINIQNICIKYKNTAYYSYWKLVAVNGVTDYYALTFPVFHLLDRIKYQYLNIPKSYE